jgi:sulfur carrier protein ThiS
MRVFVKLYGNLREAFPDYQHSQGMQVEIPEKATVKQLLASLDLTRVQGAVVIMGGRVLQEEDEIPAGVPVSIFQALQGG